MLEDVVKDLRNKNEHLILSCIFVISNPTLKLRTFTFLSSSVEDNAKQYSINSVSENELNFSEKRQPETKVNSQNFIVLNHFQ